MTTISHPANWTPPAGYHFGAHVTVRSGAGYYLIRESDGAACIALERPDYDEDDAPTAEDIDAAIAGEAGR